MKIVVWNEAVGQIDNPEVTAVYPQGLNPAIAQFLSSEKDFDIVQATLADPECGLPEELMEDTDVLIWWGHMAHALVSDEVVKRVCDHVLKGMGIIFLHSAHMAKPFMALMGTPCTLSWSEGDFYERLYTVDPTHPIAAGVPLDFRIPQEELYTEPFDIPVPDRLVFIGGFSNGAVFRSGCCYKRGYGNVFYFQPGHETSPTYHLPEVQRILVNAVRWAYSPVRRQELTCPHIKG